MKDKLPAIVIEDAAALLRTPTSDAKERLLSALTNMGYRAGEAERAVDGLGSKVESSPIGELLKDALALLG